MTAKSQWAQTISQRLLADRNDAACRMPTGIAPLDVAMRGGLMPGRGLVIGGAPGACKTTLSTQIAVHMSRGGVAVAYLAIDEAPSGVMSRILQSLGVERRRAEELPDDVIELAREHLDPLPLRIVDDMPVEETFQELSHRFGALPRCVVIDSAQTVWTKRSDKLSNPREKVNDVIGSIKRRARAEKSRAAYVVTSELARGGYSGNATAAVADLSAFKESGAIEYGVDVAVVLREQGNGTISANVCKNRLGDKVIFTLQYDPTTCSVTPTGAPATPEQVKRDSLRQGILAIVSSAEDQHTPMKRRSHVVSALLEERGSKSNRLKQSAYDELEAMLLEGVIEDLEGFGFSIVR